MSILNINKRVKNKFFNEFFKSIKIKISDDVINVILSYFNLDDNIMVLLEDKYIFNYYDHIITIGKINNFWYSDFCFNQFYKINNSNNSNNNKNIPIKWDIFQTCYNCNYCKPIYHNYNSYNYEFPNGFILKNNIKINNKFTYLCNDCYCSLY